MELMVGRAGVIHLLHVAPVIDLNQFFPVRGFLGTTADADPAARLKQWKIAILENHPELIVRVHLLRGLQVQSALASLAAKIEPDIIIIGKHRAHNWCRFLNTVSPGILSMVTQRPVLTVKRGSLRNRVRSIVYPVTNAGSAKKTGILIGLLGNYRARVYLARQANAAEDASNADYSDFVDTYRTLKQSANVSIEYVLLPGPSLPLSALHFAETVKADLLLVSPGVQSTGLIHPQLNDLVNGDSKLEVLSIA